MLFNLFKSPSFLSSSLSNPLLKVLTYGEYSNLVCSILLGLRPKPLPVKYSYLSKLLEENPDILAAFLSKSYCASFCLIFYLKL